MSKGGLVRLLREKRGCQLVDAPQKWGTMLFGFEIMSLLTSTLPAESQT